MGKYVIKSKQTEATKTFLKKWGEFTVSNSNIKGKVIVKNYRKYRLEQEIDISFEGMIYAKIGKDREWYSSEIMTNPKYRISKILLNRYIKKSIIKDAAIHLRYFDIHLRFYNDIKKVNWV